MRLLNLWPSQRAREEISPRLRLILESTFIFLLTGLLLASLYLYLDIKIKQTQAINRSLQAHIAQLDTSQQSNEESSRMKAYKALRAQHNGQLNWVVGLSQLTDEHTQLLQVKQNDEGVLIHGQSDSASEIEAFVVRIQQNIPQSKPIVQSLESKNERGTIRWVFVIQTRLGITPATIVEGGK